MRVYQDKKGFTLVELIIVMAIMAVFASAIFGAFSYINSGRTKKAAALLNSKLTYIQTKTMTEKGATYLYLYKEGNNVYILTAQEKDTNGDGKIEDTGSVHEKLDFDSLSALNGYLHAASVSGTRLCGSRVDVSGMGASSLELNDNNMIKVGYSKSTGAFRFCNDGSGSAFYNEIKLSGTETFSVKLVQATGKHFVE